MMAAANPKTGSPTGPGMPEIPKTIFEGFLVELDKAAFPSETVQRLRAAVLGKADWSFAAISAGLFPDDSA